MSRCSVHPGLICLLLLLSIPAGAQQDPNQLLARKHYELGAQLYKTSDYTRALKEFERAYELSAVARVDAADNILVFWQSNESGAYAIQGRQMSASGKTMGAPFLANTHAATTLSAKKTPEVELLHSGTVLAGWASAGQDGSSWGIVGQLFSPKGAKVGSEIILNDVVTGPQLDPVLASLGPAGFVACWDEAPNMSVHCRRFTNTGGTSGKKQYAVPANTAGNQLWPSVSAVDDKHHVVTWLDDPTKSGTYAMRLRVMSN